MTTWADYIRDDIKAHIDAGRPLPAAPTLHGLSEHYAVSMTPIRRAVRELIADGYLYRRENGRLIISGGCFGRPLKKQSPAPGPPRDYAAEIRRALAEASLAGKAVFVREEETAERFGVGTTAIRQVFHELAGAGLLEHIPRRGCACALSAARNWTNTSASGNSWSWRPWTPPGRTWRTIGCGRSTRATRCPAASRRSPGSTTRCTAT